MDSSTIASVLSITYPYLVILFWILLFAAIVWGIVQLIKKLRNKSGN